MIDLLGAAGVDPFDEAVYREVLTRHTATPAEVAAARPTAIDRP